MKKVYVIASNFDNASRCREVTEWYHRHGYEADYPYGPNFDWDGWAEDRYSIMYSNALKADMVYVVNLKDEPMPPKFITMLNGIKEAGKEVTFEHVPETPSIITLIGSRKFEPVINAEAIYLRQSFFVVLKPPFEFSESYINDPQFSTEVDKTTHMTGLEHMHMLENQQIEMADIVYVIDVDGYIGPDTQREIEYADVRNKTIMYYSDEQWRSHVHGE